MFCGARKKIKGKKERWIFLEGIMGGKKYARIGFDFH
jgi:hypothetical protein